MDVAALLLQGSIQVYSRKVEYLYSLVLRALEFLSQKGLVFLSLLNNLFWEFIVNFFKTIYFLYFVGVVIFPKVNKDLYFMSICNQICVCGCIHFS